jgi:HK97 family phage major capsid protein
LKQDVGIATWMSGIQKPTLNGLPILWLDADTFSGLGEVYYGSFKKYILIERSGIKIAKSTEAQFLEDHTLYKVVGRFGGNVIDEKYFGISNLLPTALQTRKVNHTT